MTRWGRAGGPFDIRTLLPQPGVDARNRWLFRLAQRLVPSLPRPAWHALINLGAAATTNSASRHLQVWSDNITCATGTPPSAGLKRQAIRSWLRTYLEVMALPSWSREQIVAQVSPEPAGERVLRRAYAERGVVCALPHLGNWDLAGAWAAATGMPVTSVAERLGPTEYAAFTRIRARLGIDIFAHDDPAALRGLLAAIRAGRVVCLMADRDLSTAGLGVTWNGHRVTMPAGPAMVARATGATLLGVACHYTATGMKIDFSDPVEHRPGRTGLAEMTQDLAGFFAGRVAAYPADWHVMQPFFHHNRPA